LGTAFEYVPIFPAGRKVLSQLTLQGRLVVEFHGGDDIHFLGNIHSLELRDSDLISKLELFP
jgi:hypothetical protein